VSDPRPIGIFDSGLGGLTVLSAVAARLPEERLVYLGDTARVPYGTKSAATVTRYARQCAAFLCNRGIKALVVACNTASALAMDGLRDLLAPRRVPVLGVIEPGAVEACRVSRHGRVGVIATASTIRSGAYARAIGIIKPDFSVMDAACPMLVPLAEEGWVDPADPVARATCMRYLEALVRAKIDTLILGCTHYPLLRSAIEAALRDLRAAAGPEGGPPIALVDSGAAVTHDLARMLERLGIEAPGARGAPRLAAGAGPAGASAIASRAAAYYVTDDPDRFREVAARFLGHDIEGPDTVELAELADLARGAP
jgi:glutamate racemase